MATRAASSSLTHAWQRHPIACPPGCCRASSGSHLVQVHIVSMLAVFHPLHRVLGAGNDKSIRVWDPQSGRARHTMTGHGGKVCGGNVCSIPADASERVQDCCVIADVNKLAAGLLAAAPSLPTCCIRGRSGTAHPAPATKLCQCASPPACTLPCRHIDVPLCCPVQVTVVEASPTEASKAFSSGTDRCLKVGNNYTMA